MQLTKARNKHSRKIERELQIDLGMNYNRHRVHKSKNLFKKGIKT
jgi:hypothetical protein